MTSSKGTAAMNSSRCSSDAAYVLSFLSAISGEQNSPSAVVARKEETAQKDVYDRYHEYSNVRIGGEAAQ